ncbi:uncharacterized protein EAE97_009399 [Botrytis byssoidea]|uniref:Major facilitator superfamily (MFS) profile domain-containing protein n=1 Tax=Botrytis byssoidea TaxID=139641 RepID=A0A9P5I835_9HELO|nr:uncharacterized protein EAE97_009399 [Botrytis byssoidea]KAF7931190.1 hypothetical protein EAE97_009399 [Botrytis byssoidea]
MSPSMYTVEPGEASPGGTSESLSDKIIVGTTKGVPDAEAPPITILDNTRTTSLKTSAIYVLLLALCLTLFIVNMEVTIVSTSLVAITNDLGGYFQVGWIVSGYLATYSSLIVIWAKLSDIFERKTSMIGAVLTFTLFSAGCGTSKSMTSLIICRAFQGIGAAGCYSMAMVIFFEAVPSKWYGPGGSLLTTFIALATLCGPLIGGAISESTTWRWIFLLNVPIGILTAAMLFLSIPAGFPHQDSLSVQDSTWSTLCSKDSWKKVDMPGVLLLLAATIFLITGILQAGDGILPWSSPLVVTFLVLSCIAWVSFAIWERHVSYSEISSVEPIFPWRFLHNRVWIGMLLTSFLCGLPFNIIVVSLPQRFQNVNQMSAVDSGIRILPYILVAPATSMITTSLAGRKRIPLVYLLLLGSSLQLVGTVLLLQVRTVVTSVTALYGYEAIAGCGLGVTFGILILGIPYAVERRDLATATGAMIQIRMLGGAIGLAIASSLFNSYTKRQLASHLNPDQITDIQQKPSAILHLSAELQLLARRIFAEGFEMQMILVVASVATSMISGMIVWRREQLVTVAVIE